MPPYTLVSHTRDFFPYGLSVAPNYFINSVDRLLWPLPNISQSPVHAGFLNLVTLARVYSHPSAIRPCNQQRETRSASYLNTFYVVLFEHDVEKLFDESWTWLGASGSSLCFSTAAVTPDVDLLGRYAVVDDLRLAHFDES